MILVEARRLSDSLFRSRIIDYVVNRQNEDGGYTFCQGAESNVQDTYYGLAILNMLHPQFPKAEKTYRFMMEDHTDSIYSTFYVSKASKLLGHDVSEKLKERSIRILGATEFFGSTASLPEISSEFRAAYLALELMQLLGVTVEGDKIAGWLLSFENSAGGFGTQGQSNISSTYYAVACLSLLRKEMRDKGKTINFVRSCEKPHGGFTVIPINYTPYMEDTYSGVMTLRLLGEKSRYTQQTVDWVLTCQNNKGGFARSDLGLATFQDTYFAVYLLDWLTGFAHIT